MGEKIDLSQYVDGDDLDERELREIAKAARAAFATLADLTVEAKFVAPTVIEVLITQEEASRVAPEDWQ
jgi:hypothetical protein